MDLPLLPLFPEASRAAGLQRLDGFLPRAGAAYARDRNHDRGAAVVRGNVSMLSPFLRHRLISEAEVIAAAVGRHGAAAGKFVEEVGWRSYWKGWLARRPGAPAIPGRSALAATLIDDAHAAGHAAIVVDQLIPRLQAAGLHLATRLRRWDAATAADASHGYFRFRKGLPPLVELTLSGGADELCLSDESRR